MKTKEEDEKSIKKMKIALTIVSFSFMGMVCGVAYIINQFVI